MMVIQVTPKPQRSLTKPALDPFELCLSADYLIGQFNPSKGMRLTKILIKWSIIFVNDQMENHFSFLSLNSFIYIKIGFCAWLYVNASKVSACVFFFLLFPLNKKQKLNKVFFNNDLRSVNHAFFFCRE